MMKIKTLHCIDTEYSADSIEWCPHPDYQSYFVCGTYQLEGDNSESTSPPCRRKGRIYLFRYDINENLLKEMCRIETAAILDMKWKNCGNITNYDNDNGGGGGDDDVGVNDTNGYYPVLATANALGQVEIFILKNDKLKLLSSIDLNENFHNLLTLSLDWSWKSLPISSSTTTTSSSASNNECIVASDSKGDISLISYLNDGAVLRKLTTWSAHSFEAWICTFDKWDINRIYTGGDDTFLHIFDIRDSNEVLKIETNKSHLAGVTCLLSHPNYENCLLTGSYDENLRIIDTRNYKKPLCNINLNGGIWRLKSHPFNKNLILCACMYHNFSIVKLSEKFNNIELIGEYNEHTSICYGADWCQQKQLNLNCKKNKKNGNNDADDDDEDNDDNDDDDNRSNDNDDIDNTIMATCSFYDHKLCISSITKK